VLAEPRGEILRNLRGNLENWQIFYYCNPQSQSKALPTVQNQWVKKYCTAMGGRSAAKHLLHFAYSYPKYTELPGGRNFGQKAHQRRGKNKIGWKNLWPNFCNISQKGLKNIF
jgi:hypothetical protein